MSKLFLFGYLNTFSLFFVQEADEDTTLAKVRDKLPSITLPDSYAKAVSMVNDTGMYALILDNTILAYTVGQHCTDFNLAVNMFNPSGLAFMVQKGARYLQVLSNR